MGSTGESEDQAAEVDLQRLREILVGRLPNREVEQILQRLDDPDVRAEEVSRILPQAVLLRRKKDDRLANALGPMVSGAISESVRKNPKPLADAIFPVIGPAIRKAIANALSGMVQSLNQTLEHSFSIRGLKWRFEAWRTGRPFGEVVLLHSLVYRVEQVFLVHREQGLLLHHVVAPEKGVSAHPDVVSGMLTAIQDFVRDAFPIGEEDVLRRTELGDMQILVEPGPQAYLAVVVRGNPPRSLRVTLQETLEAIHQEQGGALERFNGDNTPFEAAEPIMERCLRSEERPKRSNPLLIVLPGLAALALAVWFTLWLFGTVEQDRRFRELQALVEQEPGYRLLIAEDRGDHYRLAGVRDPLARPLEELVEESRLNPGSVRAVWDHRPMEDPEMVSERARRALDPPSSVQLRFEAGLLRMEGRASHAWTSAAAAAARGIHGVSAIDQRDLRLLELDEEQQILEAVSATSIFFAEESSELDGLAQGSIASLESKLGRLNVLGEILGRSYVLTVEGSASVMELAREELGARRARMVADVLASEEKSRIRIRTRADDEYAPEGAPASESRRAALTVEVLR